MFDLGQKVSLESFQLWLLVFFVYKFPFLAKIGLCSETGIVIQNVESKEKFSDNSGHNTKGIRLKILLIRDAILAKILKLHFITFFAVQTIHKKG